MKKLFFTLVLVFVSFCAKAQTDANAAATTTSEYDTSSVMVTRIGNTYMVGNTAMNSKAFQGFLQSRDAISYQSFRSARTLANTGWGLLAVGLACEISAIPMLVYGTFDAAGSTTQATTGEEDLKQSAKIADIVVAADLMIVGGSLVTTAGVVCVSLGYVRMHQTADNYNALQSHRRKSTGVNVALQSSRDGLGLAFQF